MTRPAQRATSSRFQPPSLRWERTAWAAGKVVVAGVDEAGRGAWAGPLVAAAVTLPASPRARALLTRALNQHGVPLRDSKLLTHAQRERGHAVVTALGLPHAVAIVEAAEIDALGLGRANRAALCRAATALNPSPEHVLVDAFRLPELGCDYDAIVHGDALCASIALASIVAKVTRDRIMSTLHVELPHYGFDAHKGYGVRAHANAIARHGVCREHRRSFEPVARALADARPG